MITRSKARALKAQPSITRAKCSPNVDPKLMIEVAFEPDSEKVIRVIIRLQCSLDTLPAHIRNLATDWTDLQFNMYAANIMKKHAITLATYPGVVSVIPSHRIM